MTQPVFTDEATPETARIPDDTIGISGQPSTRRIDAAD